MKEIRLRSVTWWKTDDSLSVILQVDMGTVTLKVDNQGRIMLPASWRRKYGVEASSELVVREHKDGSLRVETRNQGIRRAQALVRRYIPDGVSLAGELLEERREEARRERER